LKDLEVVGRITLKMDLNEIGREGMEWISLAIESMTVNLWIP
jgi:hypothetical protein